ncbi:MAG: glycosyltransferase family 2 protein [Luteimonas sp.]
MSNTPWLSILIPFYNVEAYLRECVESVLTQDVGAVGGVEVVLFNDASPDGSAVIAADLAVAYPDQVRVFARSENRGLAATRNDLLERARGAYVWMLDSDDILLPGSIRALRTVVEVESPDLVLCDFRLLRDNFGVRHRLRGELHRETFSSPSRGASGEDRDTLVAGLLESRQLHVWSKIARREIWQRAHFPEGRTFEDMAVLGKLVSGIERWTHVAQPWVGYRQRAGSIMSVMDSRKTRDLLASLCELHDDLMTLPGGLGGNARLAADYFAMRTFASLADKVAKSDLKLSLECEQAIHRVFPDGMSATLAACRRRGWWLRAARAKRRLASRGWL